MSDTVAAVDPAVCGKQDFDRRPVFEALRRFDAYDVAIVCGLAILVVLAFLTFGSYAISNDEEVQHRYGELILDYYRSGLADRGVFEFKNLYLYGGLFDIIAVLLAKIVPLDAYDL